QLAVIEKDLARVEHLLALRDRRMPITGVQKHFTFAGAHEIVLLIGNVDAMTIHFVQAILVSKTVKPKNIALVDRFDRTRMQVGIEPGRLYDARSGTLRWPATKTTLAGVSRQHAPRTNNVVGCLDAHWSHCGRLNWGHGARQADEAVTAGGDGRGP